MLCLYCVLIFVVSLQRVFLKQIGSSSYVALTMATVGLKAVLYILRDNMHEYQIYDCDTVYTIFQFFSIFYLHKLNKSS